MPEIRTAYTRTRVPFDQSIPDPITGEIQTSRTKQSFAEETDINYILARYIKTGVIDHVKDHSGYADFPAPMEYQEAMQLTIDAQLAFDELPAATRREFDNDPFKFLAFVEDPENVERMAELGLITPLEDEPASGATAEAAETPPTEEPSA